VDKLFDEDFEHIGEALANAPGANAVGAKAALYPSAKLTFIKYVEQSQQRVRQQKHNADEHALNGGGSPTRQTTSGEQELVYPISND
jgi:hypothetical protein